MLRFKLLAAALIAVAAVVAFGAGTARAENPPPVAGCGNGFSLLYNPSVEAVIAASTQGHVNGDGWFCLNSAGHDNSNGQFAAYVVIDNTVPLVAP